MTNSEDFRKWARDLVDFVADYHDTIEDRSPLAQVSPGYLQKLIPSEAPVKPDNWEDLMADVERVIMPGVTHWSNPNFHAYFPTGNSFASILGDVLSDAIGCSGFTWVASPACTELETIVMDWLGKMLGLPDTFLTGEGSEGGGVIQGTASEATVMAILAAKMKSIRCIQLEEPDLDQYDIMSKLVAYSSEQAHSSVEKAALIASVRMRSLPTDEKNALRGETLRKAIAEDRAKGRIPTFVCATLGTTNCCAFDNLEELGTICKEENLWLHVDAAYAGSALICPEYRYLAAGVELADSFNFNAHKWLRVNFDCSCMWVKKQEDLAGAFHNDPTYLKHEYQGQVIDYRHWQIPLGRRFRSLKIWFVLRLFGVEKLQEHIKTQVGLAHEFESLVLEDNRFEISADVVLGLVCFHLKATNQQNQKLLERINKTGKLFMVGATLNSKFILRFVVCSASTASEHIQYAWGIIREEASQLMMSRKISNLIE